MHAKGSGWRRQNILRSGLEK